MSTFVNNTMNSSRTIEGSNDIKIISEYIVMVNIDYDSLYVYHVNDMIHV